MSTRLECGTCGEQIERDADRCAFCGQGATEAQEVEVDAGESAGNAVIRALNVLSLPTVAVGFVLSRAVPRPEFFGRKGDLGGFLMSGGITLAFVRSARELSRMDSPLSYAYLIAVTLLFVVAVRGATFGALGAHLGSPMRTAISISISSAFLTKDTAELAGTVLGIGLVLAAGVYFL